MTNEQSINDEAEKPDENILQGDKEEELIIKSKAKFEEKENEILELNNKLTRLQADFMNYKRRNEKDKEQSVNYGIESIIIDLLPILDNFQRALLVADDREDNFSMGISMVEKQFLDVLESNSVTEIKAIGEKFDPNLHHAVSVMDGEEESGIVIEVLQKGYRIKEKIIRPSMVIVSK